MRGLIAYLLSHKMLPRETISENTLNSYIKAYGFKNKLLLHGMRATVSSALNGKSTIAILLNLCYLIREKTKSEQPITTLNTLNCVDK